MALQLEVAKTTAVVVLAAAHGLGAPVLPAAVIVALLVIQAFSLMPFLLAPPGKALSKDVVGAPSAAEMWSASMPSAASLAGQALYLILAVAFARGLRSMGLSDSPFQVMALATLGGCISSAVMMLARKSADKDCTSGCCSHGTGFWPNLESTKEKKTSPLGSLVEAYYGPDSMLSASSFLDMED